MKTTQNGSTTTYKFADKAELDAWAKENINNSAVLSAVLDPVMIHGNPKKNVVYEKETLKEV